MKRKGYTVYNQFSGQCGHLHRTPKTAEKCIHGLGDVVVEVDANGYLRYQEGGSVPRPGGHTSGTQRFRRSNYYEYEPLAEEALP